MPNTTRGYPYPASTGHARLWEYYQNLAVSIDTDVQGIADKTVGRPVCIVTAQSIQAIPHAVSTPLLFNTEVIDTHNFHSTVSLTDRLVPTVPGWYQVNTVYYMTSRGTGYLELEVGIKKNGSTVQFHRTGDNSNTGGRSITVSYTVDANGTTDYFQSCGLHRNGDGVAANTNASGASASRFEMVYLRPL